MKIHELNNFSGTLGAGSFLAVDDGNDTGKVSTQQVLAATEARIDNIIAGPAPSAQEVTDARLGADGVTYSSLGTAIRTQVTDLKSDIRNYDEVVLGVPNLLLGVKIVENKVISDTGDVWNATGYYYTDLIPVESGRYTIFFLSGTQLDTIRIHGYNSSKEWVSMLARYNGSGGQGADVLNYYFVDVPAGISYIVFSTSLSKEIKAVVKGDGTSIAQRLSDVETGKADKSIEASVIHTHTEKLVYNEIWTNLGNNYVAGYLNSSGNVASANDAYVTDYFKVNAGEPIFIKMQYGDTNSGADVCFYDANKAFISYHRKGMADARRCIGIIVPENAVYCRFDFLKAYPNPTAYTEQLANIMPNNKSGNNTVLGELKSANVVIASPSMDEFVTGWLTSSGGVTGNEAKTSRYIKLQASTPIIKHWGKNLFPSTETICFYDDELNLVLFSSNRDSVIEIPNGASYFSYSIGDTYTDDDYYLTQLQTVAVPTEAQLIAQGAKTGLAQSINLAYRGLLAGFGNSEVALRIFGTKNFNYFEEIGMPFKPSKGFKGCRDPFVVVYGEWFYFFYSNATSYLTEQNSFGVCRTRDFQSYEEFDPVVTNPDFKMCWAPSVFEENGNYYLTISGSTTSYRDCDTYIYDLDMETLQVSNGRIVHIGESRRQIDFQFYKFNGYYYAVGKYDDLGTTVIGRSETLNGPYTVLANQQYCGHHEEGQMLIRLDNGAYRLYVNDYVNMVIYYIDIPDINNPTENISELKSIVNNSPVPLFHVSVMDFNRPYSFESV